MVSILKYVKFGMLTHLQSHTAQQATNVASGIYYKHKKREINAYEQRLPPARYYHARHTQCLLCLSFMRA